MNKLLVWLDCCLIYKVVYLWQETFWSTFFVLKNGSNEVRLKFDEQHYLSCSMYIWMYYNCLFKTWTNIVIQTKVPYFRPARFWWVFLLVLLVVVVTGVKQSQLLVFKTWTKTGVWQKNSRYKNFGFKKLLFQKN